MDNDLKLLAEALHDEVNFIKERIKKLELLIGKVIEKAAANKEYNNAIKFKRELDDYVEL